MHVLNVLLISLKRSVNVPNLHASILCFFFKDVWTECVIYVHVFKVVNDAQKDLHQIEKKYKLSDIVREYQDADTPL